MLSLLKYNLYKVMLKFISACLFSVFSIAAVSGPSDLTIDVTNGTFALVPIGIIGFDGAGVGAEISAVVENDLRGSGAFQVLNGHGTQSVPESFNKPSLWEWRYANGAIVVCGIISDDSDLNAVIRIYDVDSGRMKEGKVTAPSGKWRLLAHRISNAIYKISTGEDGYFDTQIVYAAQSGPATNKSSQIVIMDQDGANCRVMTPAGSMALTPRFSPDGKYIAYSTLSGYEPSKIYIMNVQTGEKKLVHTGGIGISPRFSPDNRELIYAVAKNGTTSLNRYNISSGSVRKFYTPGGRIDVSPSFAPNGSIVFASDRDSPYPKLYVMDSSGSARRIGSDTGSYYCPVYSPDGKWIAFVKRVRGSYYLGVCGSDGSGERLIVSAHVVDYPSWAPNSGMIVCAVQDFAFGPFSIYAINLSGRAMRKIRPELKVKGANHPDWGPRITQ